MVLEHTSLKPVWRRLIVAFAWASLALAFVVGQIAVETDYEALLLKEVPTLKVERSKVYKDLPVVYAVRDEDETENVVVMAEGMGFGGPLVLGVQARRTADGARIGDIIVLANKETPPFLERVKRKFFFRQFAGKSVTDDFIIGRDIDAVSGATVTSVGFTTAVRAAVHRGARDHLGLKRTWREPGWTFGVKEAGLLALFAAAFSATYWRHRWTKYLRYAVMAAALGFVGFYANISISLGGLAALVMGYLPPFKQHLLWWIMMAGVLGSVFFLGRNIYCQSLCPFRAVQDLLRKISGFKIKVNPAMQRQAHTVIFFLSWVALMLIFLSRHPALGSYEPFSMMFSLEGMGIQWYILPATLAGSLFVPMFWCRLFCPVGLYLNEIVHYRATLRDRLLGKKTKGRFDRTAPYDENGGDVPASGEEGERPVRSDGAMQRKQRNM